MRGLLKKNKMGRNRLKACNELNIIPKYEEYNGDDALQYVISTNLQRRHLTASQRAMVARKSRSFFTARAKERQATSTGGDNPQLVELIPQAEQGKARDELGEAFNVSGRYIDEAERIIEKKPELEEKLISGEVTITEAAK